MRRITREKRRFLPVAAGALAVAAAFAGCAAAMGVRPGDMNAGANRQTAAAHEATAERHESHYDPDAMSIGPGDTDHNPTQENLFKTQFRERHGWAHRSAATELERFEETECAEIEHEERAVCPLFEQMQAADPIEGGVRVRFRAGTDLETTETHIGCHLTLADTAGYEDIDQCPLYVRGVEVERGPLPLSLELRTEGERAVSELRRRVAEMLEP